MTCFVRLAAMPEPTKDDIDALVGPATPHFAYQLRARVEERVRDLNADHPVRRYAEEKMALLDRLGHASSKAEEGGREPRTRSEEHTSELQSRRDLVCRLLLEKKNKTECL